MRRKFIFTILSAFDNGLQQLLFHFHQIPMFTSPFLLVRPQLCKRSYDQFFNSPKMHIIYFPQPSAHKNILKEPKRLTANTKILHAVCQTWIKFGHSRKQLAYPGFKNAFLIFCNFQHFGQIKLQNWKVYKSPDIRCTQATHFSSSFLRQFLLSLFEPFLRLLHFAVTFSDEWLQMLKCLQTIQTHLFNTFSA